MDESNKAAMLIDGVQGVGYVDAERGRLVFEPDEAGIASDAYKQKAAEWGQWDQWVIETDVAISKQPDGVLLVEVPR